MMNIHAYLKSHSFQKSFEEKGLQTFYIYMWHGSFFVWGYLDSGIAGILCSGKSGWALHSPYCRVHTICRYFSTTPIHGEMNDTFYTISLAGDLMEFLDSPECQAMLYSSTPFEDAPGVIDAIIIPDEEKDKIYSAANSRMKTLAEKDASFVMEKYIQRELYSKQLEYMGRYPDVLRQALIPYFQDLPRQISVYNRIYNRDALEAVQSLL